LKKCEAYFFKGEKAAAFRLRSLPAGEAKHLNLKDLTNEAEMLQLFFDHFFFNI
jgi:hypothetical protein